MTLMFIPLLFLVFCLFVLFVVVCLFGFVCYCGVVVVGFFGGLGVVFVV